MPPLLVLRILCHQILRTFRFGSRVENVVSLLVRGSTLIGTALFGVVFLVLLPALTRENVLGPRVSAFLADYLFLTATLVVVANSWLPSTTSLDVRSYRFYPVSMSRIALTLQLVGAVHVRYLSLGLAAIIALVVATSSADLFSILVIGMFILMLDEATLLIKAIPSGLAWHFGAIVVLLVSLALYDAFGGHHVSAYLFDFWRHSADGAAAPVIAMLAATSLLVGLGHQRLRTILRYGT